MKKTKTAPLALDLIADTVLAYKPKDKLKASKVRAKKKTKRGAKGG